jgi:hypothetical protein
MKTNIELDLKLIKFLCMFSFFATTDNYSTSTRLIIFTIFVVAAAVWQFIEDWFKWKQNE